MGRCFSRLLVEILARTFGKGSMGFLLKSDAGRDLKETLPNVRLDQLRPALPALAELDRIGAAIPDLLRGYWVAQGL